MDRVLDLTAFVFQVYRRSLAEGEQLGSEDLEKMRKDDWRTLPDSIVFAATDLEGRYLATIRIMEKGKALLPVERDFGLDVWGVCKVRGIVAHRIFEIGRLAKDAGAVAEAGLSSREGMALVDDLFAWTVWVCSQEPGNVWFAALDAQVYCLLRRRGFPFVAIGRKVDYLGSPTLPVMLPIDVCRRWMRRRRPRQYTRYFQETGQWVGVG